MRIYKHYKGKDGEEDHSAILVLRILRLFLKSINKRTKGDFLKGILSNVIT